MASRSSLMYLTWTLRRNSNLNINLSGDFPIEKLKEFGEYLKDEIEGLAEIKQVDIRGHKKRKSKLP
jgi:hypothetical protein